MKLSHSTSTIFNLLTVFGILVLLLSCGPGRFIRHENRLKKESIKYSHPRINHFPAFPRQNAVQKPNPLLPKGLLNPSFDDSLLHTSIQPRDTLYFTVYSDSNGTKAGKLGLYYPYFLSGNYGPGVQAFWINGTEKKEAQPRDYYREAYLRLHFFDQKNGYIQIFSHSHEGGIWLKEEEVGSRFHPICFAQYLQTKASWQFYGYSGQALWTHPANDAQKMIVLDENKHRIREFTGIVEGNWAQVVVFGVEKYNETWGPCYSDEELQEHWDGGLWTGWIQLVDTQGQINPFKYYGAC